MKCGWRTAFIAQGKSDFVLFQELRVLPSVKPCHYLHYLQMAVEKIAKGLNCRDESTRPPETHRILVRWMKQLMTSKPHSDWLAVCRCKSDIQFKAYLKGLVDFADCIEALSPAVAKQRPNAEYPWYDEKDDRVYFPAEYPYHEIVRNEKFYKLILFIEASLKFAEKHP